jgi:large-conductance mechanosensitive channel
MKKSIAILLAVLLLLVPAATVLAASAGEYIIDEVNMTVDVPAGYDVFTRDSTDEDSTLAVYGYTEDELRAELIDADSYLYAFSNTYLISIMVSEDEFSEQVGDLTALEEQYSKELQQQINSSADSEFNYQQIVYKNAEIYKNDYTYLRFDVEGSFDEYELDGLGYLTIVDDKYYKIVLMMYDGVVGSSQKQEFEDFVDGIAYSIDEQAATQTSTASQSSAEEKKSNTLLHSVIAIVSIIIIALVIFFIIRANKKKKKAVMEAVQQTQMPAIDEENGEMLDKTKDSTTGAYKQCPYCRKEVPKDSAFCPICGEKLK